MPFTFNGIGTSLSGNFAPIHWQKPSWLGPQADHDAVECFVVLYLPIIPLRAVHTFSWSGNQYKMVGLRQTGALLLHVYLRFLGLLLTVIGIVGLAVAAIATVDSARRGWAGAQAGVTVALILGLPGFGLLRWLRTRHARTRDIRLVIGPHHAGSSDPALWHQQVLDQVRPTPIGDAQAALGKGRFDEAMFIARIAAAQKDPEAERLTDEILARPEVRSALPALREEPWRRGEILGSAGWAASG
jgi:hypothetical protein